MYLKSFRCGKKLELSGYSGTKGHNENNISLGNKITMKKVDGDSYSMLSKLSSIDKPDSDSSRNPQLLFSFSEQQELSFKEAVNPITRMNKLETFDMNPSTTDSDLENYNKEFFERPYQLDNSAKDKDAFAELKYGDENRVSPRLGITPPGNGLINKISPISTVNNSWSSSSQFASICCVVRFLDPKITDIRFPDKAKQVTQQMKSSHDNNASLIIQVLITDTDNNINSTCYSALPPGDGFSIRTQLTHFHILQ